MAIIHTGKDIPQVRDVFAPGDNDWLSFVWDAVLEADETVVNSSWVLTSGSPSGLTIDQQVIGSVTDKPTGAIYSKGTSARLIAVSEGSYKLTNTITTSIGRILSRSVWLVVDANV